MSIIQAFTYRSKIPAQIAAHVQGSALTRPSGTFTSRTTINIPAHNPGDLLVAIGTNIGSVPPSVSTAGWSILSDMTGMSVTSMVSSTVVTTNYSSKCVYKTSQTGAAETCTFFGSGSDPDFCSSCFIFRNVTGIGAFKTSIFSGGGTNIPVPSLTLQVVDGSSTVVVLTPKPLITSSNIPGIVINTGGAYNLNVSAFSGGAVFTSKTIPTGSIAIELLN